MGGVQLEFLEENGEVVALKISGVGINVQVPRVREGR
jgi:hypothetical protein